MGTSIGVATGGPVKKCDIRDWPGKTLYFGLFLHRIDVASRENAIPAFSVWWVLLWRGESRYRKLRVFQFFRKTTSTYIPSGRVSKITRIIGNNTYYIIRVIRNT